jgi:FAD/FMN-containing dehydrogenase
MSSNTSPDLAQPSESTPPLDSGPRSRPLASDRAAYEPSRSYLYCALTTSLNIALHVLSGSRFIWLEGRVSRGRFSNWLRRFRHRPRRVLGPTSERELSELVQAESALRVVGAGHSFNSGVVSHDTLVSLDGYAGVIELDRTSKQVTVRGGTRVRDVSRFLLREGLALENLPSHDAQSVAGILSTDVHGTSTHADRPRARAPLHVDRSAG